MTDILALDLVEKRLVTNQLTLNIAYDVLNLTDPKRRTEKLFYGQSVLFTGKT